MNSVLNEHSAALYIIPPFIMNGGLSLWLMTDSTHIVFKLLLVLATAVTLYLGVRIYKHELAQKRVQLSEAIIDGVAGLVVVNKDLTIERVNRQFTAITAYTARHLESKSIIDLPFLSGSSVVDEVTQHLSANARWKGEFSGLNRLGGRFTVTMHVEKVVDMLGQASKYVVTFTDISRRKSLEDRLRKLIETDPLTSCWNRRRFDRELVHYAQLSKRHQQAKACLAILDIDHFKQINDRFGHNVGDETLKEVAHLLKMNVRETDHVYRIGGEEFAIMMPETDLDDAFEAMYRLKEVITRGTQLNVTLSCGVAEIGNADEAFRQADSALYVAKSSGRNQVSSAPKLEGTSLYF